VVLGDLAGYVLFQPWPEGEPLVVRAHGDAGPAAAVGVDLATAGGWDPEVTRWDPSTGRPRWSRRPFDGRVTALCGREGDLLVGGADRAGAAGAPHGPDRAPLGPGRVVSIDAEGTVSGALAELSGEVLALACGPGWLAALDGGPDPGVLVIDGGGEVLIPVTEPAGAALASSGHELLISDGPELAAFDVRRRERRVVAARPAARWSLGLVAIGDAILEATAEGLVRWPDGEALAPIGRQPVALARHGESALVLWPDGLLEERDPSGALLRRREIAFES